MIDHYWFTNEIWKGKITLVLVGIIHVILLKTLQHLVSQILQTKWSVILNVVGYAECKSIVQNRKYCFQQSLQCF